MIDKKLLLFLAGFVWSIAGYNVLHIGCQSYIGNISLKLITLSIIIFLFFKYMIFDKMVKNILKELLSIKIQNNGFGSFLIWSHL